MAIGGRNRLRRWITSQEGRLASALVFQIIGFIDRQVSAAQARAIIMEIERSLGYEPTDREFEFGILRRGEKSRRTEIRPLEFERGPQPYSRASASQDMSTTVLTLFNNKGVVGKTSLVYHLSWMLADGQARTRLRL